MSSHDSRTISISTVQVWNKSSGLILGGSLQEYVILVAIEAFHDYGEVNSFDGSAQSSLRGRSGLKIDSL